MIETAIILAGGLATRLRPITEKIPKSLVEVVGRPFIEHQLSLLKVNGFRKVILCLGYLGEQVVEVVGNGEKWGLQVEYSFDGPILLGTGGALLKARSLLDEESFWVLYGDSYLDFDYEAVSQYFGANRQNTLGLMTVFANDNHWDTSNVVFRDNKILKYDKWQRTPEMDYIDYGASILSLKALDMIKEIPFDLSKLYYYLVENELMLGYEVKRRFYEVGSFSGLQELNDYFAKQEAK